MKKTFLLGLALCWMAWQISGCATKPPTEASLGETWLTDYPAAQAQAKAEGKLVFVDFEGSDWCPGCIALKREVFLTRKFASYARANLILVAVDFPQGTDLPPAQKKANDKLSRDLKVDGIPTTLLMTPEGHELGRLEAYVTGGTPEGYIEQVERIRRTAAKPAS